MFYPRHVSESLKGIQCKLGAPQRRVKPVTIQLDGTLITSLWGKRTFSGIVNIDGSTYLNRGMVVKRPNEGWLDAWAPIKVTTV